MIAASWLPDGFEFLSGLPEQARRKRKLVNLQAFIDDSGVKGQGKVLVLCALSAQADVWADASDEWNRRLRATTSISYFKMYEAKHLSGEFYGWQPEARDDKVMSLARAIDRSDICATYYVVHLRSFRELITRRLSGAFKKEKDWITQPYLWALNHLIVALGCDALDRGERRQMEILVDNQYIFSDAMKREYPLIRNNLTSSLRSVLPLDVWFRDDKDFVPLQAADLFASQLRMACEGLARRSHPLGVVDLSKDDGIWEESNRRWCVSSGRI